VDDELERLRLDRKAARINRDALEKKDSEIRLLRFGMERVLRSQKWGESERLRLTALTDTYSNQILQLTVFITSRFPEESEPTSHPLT
jgi:hypothetical protein